MWGGVCVRVCVCVFSGGTSSEGNPRKILQEIIGNSEVISSKSQGSERLKEDSLPTVFLDLRCPGENSQVAVGYVLT